VIVVVCGHLLERELLARGEGSQPYLGPRHRGGAGDMMMDWVSPAAGDATAHSFEAVRVGPARQGTSGMTDARREPVALTHLTRAALQGRGLALARSLSDLEKLDDAESIEKMLERRQALLTALEVDRSVLAELQADLVVLAPLLASAAAVALPKS